MSEKQIPQKRELTRPEHPMKALYKKGFHKFLPFGFQRELAKKFNIPPMAVSMVVCGKVRNPNLEKIIMEEIIDSMQREKSLQELSERCLAQEK